MPRNLHIVLAAAGALATTAAFAADMADTDGDGMISIEEFTAAWPQLAPTVFTTVDLDGNGMIDDAELAQGRESGMIPADQG